MSRVELKPKSSAFTNEKCPYWPCHDTDEKINCLFCCCALYRVDCERFGGEPYITATGVKDCSNCMFPHKYENEQAMWKAINEISRGGV